MGVFQGRLPQWLAVPLSPISFLGILCLLCSVTLADEGHAQTPNTKNTAKNVVTGRIVSIASIPTTTSDSNEKISLRIILEVSVAQNAKGKATKKGTNEIVTVFGNVCLKGCAAQNEYTLVDESILKEGARIQAWFYLDKGGDPVTDPDGILAVQALQAAKAPTWSGRVFKAVKKLSKGYRVQLLNPNRDVPFFVTICPSTERACRGKAKITVASVNSATLTKLRKLKTRVTVKGSFVSNRTVAAKSIVIKKGKDPVLPTFPLLPLPTATSIPDAQTTVAPTTPVPTPTNFPEGSKVYTTRLNPTGQGYSSTGYAMMKVTIKAGNSIQLDLLTFNYTGLGGAPTKIILAGSDGTTLWDLTGTLPGQTRTVTFSGESAIDLLSALQRGFRINIATDRAPLGEVIGSFTESDGSINAPPIPTAPPAVDNKHVTAEQAARYLTQSTFGPTTADIDRVVSMGIEADLDAKLNKTDYSARPCMDLFDQWEPRASGSITYCLMVLSQSDAEQLRMRVTKALVELFVINREIGPFQLYASRVGTFHDLVASHVFGNFEDLLYDMTLNPAMMVYLNMHDSKKANPNQNYAREVLQLFSIGLTKLWEDGTAQFDRDGNPIPTYDNSTILGLAKVLTGWYVDFWDPKTPLYNPAEHSTDPDKTFLGQTLQVNVDPSDPDYGPAELKAAIKVIFNHPNVGPYIGKYLIQKLVTSNPSPGYVYRVTQVFNNNGKGVRGDLKAVIRAILLDPEARSTKPDSTFGIVQDPLLMFMRTVRIFHIGHEDGTPSTDYWWWTWKSIFGLDYMASRTVFGHTQTYYIPPQLASLGLMLDGVQLVPRYGVVTTDWYWGQMLAYLGTQPAYGVVSRYTELRSAMQSGGFNAVLDWMNLHIFAGQMSNELRATLTAYYASTPWNEETGYRRIVYLALMSPEAWGVK